MEEDPLIQKKDITKNVIESVSRICNLYSKSSSEDMFTGAHVTEMGSDHSRQSKGVKQTMNKKYSTTKKSMKAKFEECSVELKWVSLFPHIDDFNGREPGHNFLGSVSRTVIDDNSKVGLTGGVFPCSA
jgi:hypothetical protein